MLAGNDGRAGSPESQKRATPRKSAPPAYKAVQGDVKTNVDRARADKFKKTKPYAVAVRAGYDAASPAARQARSENAGAKVANARAGNPTTFNGINLAPTREDRIVLAEHLRRARQTQTARDFQSPNRDTGATDMAITRAWEKSHPSDQSGRLQTGQTAYGPRPSSTAATRLAAEHPGITTSADRVMSAVGRLLHESQPPTWEAPQTGRRPGDYRAAAGYVDPLTQVKPEDASGTAGIATVLNPFTLFSKAGTVAGDVAAEGITAGIKGLNNSPMLSQALTHTPLGSLIAGSKALDASGLEKVPGNAARDFVDLYAQALPSLYQTGKDSYKAIAHGDTAGLEQELKGMEQMLLHPKDHPLAAALLVKGGAHAVGRVTGTGLRAAGRTGSATAARLGSIDRAPLAIPHTPDGVARRYSKDSLRKVMQVATDKVIDAEPKVRTGRAGRVVSGAQRGVRNQLFAHEMRTAVDEEVGVIEATRRHNRDKVQADLLKATPRKVRNLVPFISDGTALSKGTLRADLTNRLKVLNDERHALAPKARRNNEATRVRLDKLLADPHLEDKWDAAAGAAGKYADLKRTQDELLTKHGHLLSEQARKAALIPAAVQHFAATHDESPRATARAVLRDGIDKAVTKAEQTVNAARGKLDTATEHVRRERVAHQTAERRGKVPGGKHKPLEVQNAEARLKAAESTLKRHGNKEVAQAFRAGDVSGAARVRVAEADRKLLKSDPQYARLRRELSATRQAEQTAQTHFNNAHGTGKSKGAEAAHSDAERSVRAADLAKAQQARDVAEGHLHSYLDDVQRAADEGTRKQAAGPAGRRQTMDVPGGKLLVNDRVSPTSKTEAHYSGLGRKPVGGLRAAERENAGMQAARVERANHYAELRAARRNLRDASRRSSKLKPTDHARMAKLVAARDKLAAEHEAAVFEHQGLKDSAKEFKVNKSDRTFIPGMVDAEGKPLGTDTIEAGIREKGGNPDLIAFTTHRTSQLGSAAGFRDFMDTQFEKRFTRTGESYRVGAYDSSFGAMVDSLTRGQSILDAIHGREQVINRFATAAGRDAEGNPIYHHTLGEADIAAQEYNSKHGLSDQDGMVPFLIADARQDNIRLAQFKKNLDPGIAAEFEAEIGTASAMKMDHTVTPDGVVVARDYPGAKWALMPNPIAARILNHDKVIEKTVSDRVISGLVQRWRNSILYGTSVWKWTFGNVAEMQLRLVASGAAWNPVTYGANYMLGRRIFLAVMDHHKDDPQMQARLRNLFLSGGHFEGNHILITRDHLRDDQQKLLGYFEKQALAHPRAGWSYKVPVGAWAHWKDMVRKVNRKSEEGGDYAIIGKLARDDIHATAEFNRSWEHTLHVGQDAVASIAKGLLEQPEQIRYMRHATRVIGQYRNLSPAARRWIATYTTFGLWARNALIFGISTLPRHSPVLTGLLAASYAGSEDYRMAHGQHTFGPGRLDDFLQGTLMYGDGPHNWEHYTPFSAYTNPESSIANQFLPSFQSVIDAFSAKSFTGADITMPDGTKPDSVDRIAIAVYATMESMVPFLPVVRKLREHGGKPYANSNILSPKTKPGTRDKNSKVLERWINPGAPMKRPAPKGTTSRNGPSIPDIPDIKLPSTP